MAELNKFFSIDYDEFIGRLIAATKKTIGKTAFGQEFKVIPTELKPEVGMAKFLISYSYEFHPNTKLCSIQFNYVKQSGGVMCYAEPVEWGLPTYKILGKKSVSKYILNVFDNI